MRQNVSTKSSSSKSKICNDLQVKYLDVPNMTKHHFWNYDTHVQKFIQFLKEKLNAVLVYEGPDDVYQHILERTIYACSVFYKSKYVKDVFPIMIGSRLDLSIRHHGIRSFDFLPDISRDDEPFQDLDIGRGFFIINGFLRHVPNFYTNNPTNTHVIGKSMVRVYSYDEFDHGSELIWYTQKVGDKKPGQLVIKDNGGNECDIGIDHFYNHCPYSTCPTVYMSWLFRYGNFDIDDLNNKIFITSGHLFVKMFIKYFYLPLLHSKWDQIKSKHKAYKKWIETGDLLHTISRRIYFKGEGKSSGKMTSAPLEMSSREIGDNGKIYKEKSIGCYREISSQTYPLNPYLLQMVVRLTSNKVKANSLPAYPENYLGFICVLGCFETKNVGRTSMLVRNTIISAYDDLDAVFYDGKKSNIWKILNLKCTKNSTNHFVVVNEACIPVTEKCFDSIDLFLLKRTFELIECFVQDKFVFIRYKTGLLFRKLNLPKSDQYIWVTSRDEMFWSNKLYNICTKDALIKKFEFDYMTGYLADLNPFFRYNAVPKTVLAFNALKNAVLAVDAHYARYFMDTVTAHTIPNRYHQVVLPPKNAISEKFVMKAPRITISYMSWMGCTQEDCIVKRQNVDAFDCVRFYTLRAKIECDGPCTFHPVRGDVNDEDTLLGSLVNHGKTPLIVEFHSLQVTTISKSAKHVTIHFSKIPFRVIQYVLSHENLAICVEQNHEASTGDKVCSFHGQKGVMRIAKHLPILNDSVEPDVIVNPYSLFRMTGGQVMEGLNLGNGRDAKKIRNSNGQIVPGASAYYADTLYFPIAYWASEHIYAPRHCVLDKILNQAVKGRSRNGGMRIGTMEAQNGMRANGIGSCFEEKFFEHGDAIAAIPKSVQLVVEDAKFFKFDIKYRIRPSVVVLE